MHKSQIIAIMASATCTIRERQPKINYQRLVYEIKYKNSDADKNAVLLLLKRVMMSVSPRLQVYIKYGDLNRQLYNQNLFCPPISLQPCYPADTLHVLYPADFQIACNTKLVFEKPKGETAMMHHIRAINKTEQKNIMPRVPIDGFHPDVQITLNDLVAKPVINEVHYAKYCPWPEIRDNCKDVDFIEGCMAKHTVVQIPCILYDKNNPSEARFSFQLQGSQSAQKYVNYAREYILNEFDIVISTLKQTPQHIDSPDGLANMHIEPLLQTQIMKELKTAIILRIANNAIVVEMHNKDEDMPARAAKLIENKILPDVKKIIDEFEMLVKTAKNINP